MPSPLVSNSDSQYVRRCFARLRSASLPLACLGVWLALGALGCSQPREIATIRMADGAVIEIELRPDKAPKTVESFKRLANEGFYDGTTFHLAIPKFMIQGGDPNSKNDNMFDDGYGNPGFTIEDEFNDLSHVPGAVSIAKTEAPNSGGSQFFIIVSEVGANGENWAEELDGRYTIFGQVRSGLDEAIRISEAPTGNNEIPGQDYRPDEDQVIESIRIGPSSAEPS